MAEETEAKWEGKSTAKLRGATSEQVWASLEDFCGVDMLLPAIDTCYQLQGEYGRPGLTRYVASTVQSLSGAGYEKLIKWCHEQLLEMDPIGRSLTYQTLENNMGIKSYHATIKVLPIDGGDEEPGCQIEWSFVGDPIQGLTFEAFYAYIESSVQAMAENIGKALHSSSSAEAELLH